MAGIAITDRFGCDGKFVVLESRPHLQSAPDARLALDTLAIQRLEQCHKSRRIQAWPRCGRGAGQTFELRYTRRPGNLLLRRAVIEDEIDHPLRLRGVAGGTRHRVEMRLGIRKPGRVRSERLRMAAKTDISSSHSRRGNAHIMGAVAIEAKGSRGQATAS